MKQVGTFKSERWGSVNVLRATYGTEDGPTAVLLRTVEGAPLANLSVNIYTPDWSHDSADLPAGCFYVKQWSGHAELAAEALASGLFAERKDLPSARSDFVVAPVWQIVGSAS